MLKTYLIVILSIAATGIALTVEAPATDDPQKRFTFSPEQPARAPADFSYKNPPMVFIPDGEYEMGDHFGSGPSDELPVHAVEINDFLLDTYEVTNKDYCLFLNSVYRQGSIEVVDGVVYRASSGEPYLDLSSESAWSHIHWNENNGVFFVTPGRGSRPLVLVSWYGAAAYANWRSVQLGFTPCYDLATWSCTFENSGFRLPTEAEWEKAARGGEYSPYRVFPWGDLLDGSHANYRSSGDPFETGGYPWTSPVGYYDGNQSPPGVNMANGYGLYDMAGNVKEWCNDWYDEGYYQDCVWYSIDDNPQGPEYSPDGTRILRGGSWLAYEYSLKCAARSFYYPDLRVQSIGFRLARRP